MHFTVVLQGFLKWLYVQTNPSCPLSLFVLNIWIFNLKIDLCEICISVYHATLHFFREWTRLFDVIGLWNIRKIVCSKVYIDDIDDKWGYRAIQNCLNICWTNTFIVRLCMDIVLHIELIDLSYWVFIDCGLLLQSVPMICKCLFSYYLFCVILPI